MPPKQATLGYVKDSQTNITCVFRRISRYFAVFANTASWNSKFFGAPNGPKPPAKQSKLAFSSKSTSNGATNSSASKENDDVDMEDAVDKEVSSKVKDDAIAKKENVKPGTGRSRCGRVKEMC